MNEEGNSIISMHNNLTYNNAAQQIQKQYRDMICTILYTVHPLQLHESISHAEITLHH